LVHHIEQALINTLADYGFQAERHKGAPGIYLAKQAKLSPTWVGAKIGALGLKVSRQASYHGLALNVAMDLSPFTQINPCGFKGLKTVDMQTLGIEDNIDIVGQHVVTHLLQLLQNRN
jgi:lipoyl(octanoyl) transferase